MTENLPAPQEESPASGGAASGNGSPYNAIFEKLVDDAPPDEQVAGAIAYVFYKVAKREWVMDFCERNGRPPNDAELNAYIATWTESRISGVADQARSSLASFASYVIEKERPRIVEEALRERSFWREAGVAFVGAFFYTVALLIFAVILKFAHIDLLAILEKIH